MIRYLLKLMGYPRMHTAEQKEGPAQNLFKSLAENHNKLKEILGESSDIIMRNFEFGRMRGVKGLLIFVDGLVKSDVINECVVKPLMYDSTVFSGPTVRTSHSIESLKNTMVAVGDVKEVKTFEEVTSGCLGGDTVLLIDGFDKALVISSRGWDKRGVEEPRTEAVVRGPREGFNESLRTNTALMRRKIKSPALRMESFCVGRKTRTDVVVVYLDGVADLDLLSTVRERLNAIDTDAIFESGYIEQFIGDAPFSLFPTLGYSEKPDVVASCVLEGRVAIIVDGTPFVLTAPRLIIESFQSAEDYYISALEATVLRLLRFIAFFISITAPAVYVALTTFHQELIPTPLLLTMMGAREGVPYPALMEAGIMMVIFEILREAGLRLPRPVGQAVSIVGALVMGESAVSAGLISAPMVIVVAIMAVSGFVVPTLEQAGSILRVILLILGGVMGGFGIVMGLLGTLIHLSSLKSFGVPVLSPIAPVSSGILRDGFFRAPLWAMRKRPEYMAEHDHTRQHSAVPPAQPPDETSG